MSDNLQEQLNKLLLVISAGGDEVEGYKKLKACYYLLQENYECLPKYDWPWEFWGPDDPTFSYLIEKAVNSSLITRKLKLKKGEPIHHPYALTDSGLFLIDTYLKQNKGKEKYEFLKDAIIYLELPSVFSVNLATSEQSKNTINMIQTKNSLNFKRINHPDNFFSEKVINSMVSFYDYQGFKPEHKTEKGSIVHRIDLQISRDAMDKRYNYLAYEDSKLIKDHIDNKRISNIFDSELPVILLEKNKVLKKDAVLNNIINIEKQFEIKDKIIDASNRNFQLQDKLFNVTDKNDIYLTLRIGEKYSELSLNKREIENIKINMNDLKWRDYYYFHYWHALQPYELRDIFQYFSPEFLYKKIGSS